MNKEISSFESIVPTAITVLYPRIFTDIPFSNEIYTYLKNNIEVASYLPKDILAIELEARYKLMDRLIKENNVKQVLELAAGYSQRGLIFAKDYDYKYVEVELKKVADFKKKMLNSISNIPNNLHIIDGDATNKNDFDKCKEFFDTDKKIAVINEGLLRYLNFEEKRQVAENVFTILKEFGGVWITCDVTPKRFIQNQSDQIPSFNPMLDKATDRNNANWRFEDENHVKNFLAEVGFKKVKFHYFNEAKNELVSPLKFNLSSNEVDKLIDGALVAVISID